MQKRKTQTSERCAVAQVVAHNYHQQQPKKKLSSCIIIATRNRLPDMLTFLDSIVAQTVQPDELIIVDSSDKKLIDYEQFTKKFSDNFFPVTKLIYKHTTKPGAARQRNIGARFSSADIFYFFDDDTVLNPDYLELINGVLQENPQYGGGMGTLQGVPPKSMTFDRFIKYTFMLQRDNASGKFTLSGMPTHTYGLPGLREVQVLGGCCAYRSSVFKQHWFDENLGRYSYMEDCDLSFWVSRKYPLFFYPKACLDHRQSLLARDTVEDNRAIYIRNYSYLFFKNFYPRNKFKIFAYWWSVLGLFVQAILVRNKAYIRGYLKGLYQYYTGR